MIFLHQHPWWSALIIWFVGLICMYAYLAHYDSNPKLSGDTRMPPVMELMCSIIWPLTLIGLILNWLTDLKDWFEEKIDGG